jgi:hypothetical protein
VLNTIYIMALNFPDSPVLNQVFSALGKRWKWDGTTWISLYDKGNVKISDVPPPDAVVGDLWYDSSTGVCFVYYYDGDTYQWADIGTGGNTLLSSISSINSSTLNLSFDTNTNTLSGNVSSISSFFTGTNQSLTTNGYQRLPGGLIVQWFRGGIPLGSPSVTVTLPIAFPNAYLTGAACETAASGWVAGTATVFGITCTTTQINIYGRSLASGSVTSPGGITYGVIVIGY